MNCENCTKYKGDCGHHAIDSDKHIRYDAPGKSSRNRYGECSFYVESRSKFQIQIDLLEDIGNIELADLNVSVLRQALECALRNERKE